MVVVRWKKKKRLKKKRIVTSEERDFLIHSHSLRKMMKGKSGTIRYYYDNAWWTLPKGLRSAERIDNTQYIELDDDQEVELVASKVLRIVGR